MTFTFDESDISTNLSKVRVLIGDTDSTDQLLSDEIINFYLAESSDNIYTAASSAANAVQAKFAKLADTTVETVSVKYSQKAKQYAELSSDLSSAADGKDLAVPHVGGVSVSDVQSVRRQNDRVDSKFYMDQFSNPTGFQSEYDETER